MTPPHGSLPWEALQTALALASVLALVLLTGLAARRHKRFAAGAGRATDPAALHLRATIALDSRRRLHLVETAHGPVLALTGGTLDALVALPQPTMTGQAGASPARP